MPFGRVRVAEPHDLAVGEVQGIHYPGTHCVLYRLHAGVVRG